MLFTSEGYINVCGYDTRDEEHFLGYTPTCRHEQNPDQQILAAVVEEDVAFGCENLKISSAEIRKTCRWH